MTSTMLNHPESLKLLREIKIGRKIFKFKIAGQGGLLRRIDFASSYLEPRTTKENAVLCLIYAETIGINFA